MIITLREILASQQALSELAQEKFNARMAYQIAKTLNDVNREFEALRKQHAGLIEKHGYETVQTDAGEMRVVMAENQAAFQAEFNELLDIETEIWGNPLSLDALGNVQISPASVAALGWLWKDDETQSAETAKAAGV